MDRYAAALTSQGMDDIHVPHIYDFLTRYVYDDDSPDPATFFRTNPGYRGFRCPFKKVIHGNGWAQGHMGKEYILNGTLSGRDVTETNAPQRFGIHSIEQLSC